MLKGVRWDAEDAITHEPPHITTPVDVIGLHEDYFRRCPFVSVL
jgi:hypothetical protein